MEMIEGFKNSMMEEFAMTDLGKMKYFLGVEVIQDERGIFINQRKYAAEIIKKYGMEGCNSVKNPIVPGQKLTKAGAGDAVDPTEFKQLIGSLRYLTTTRPDLIFSVNLVSRYMESPNEQHLLAVKRILRYVQGTLDLGIQYERGGATELVGFVDSDYAGDVDDRKSTSGYVFMLGGGAIAWASKKQPIVTLSTTEAEFTRRRHTCVL
ncbi:putative RNA-directed DNA polymerase [Arabidopsis thaliana]